MCLWVEAAPKEATPRTRFDSILVERRVGQGKIFCISTEKPRIHSLPFKPLLLVVNIAIHEAIHHGGMRMDVDVEIKVNICIFVELHQKIFTGYKSWVGPRRWFLPVTIQVKTHQRATVIAENNTVWV